MAKVSPSHNNFSIRIMNHSTTRTTRTTQTTRTWRATSSSCCGGCFVQCLVSSRRPLTSSGLAAESSPPSRARAGDRADGDLVHVYRDSSILLYSLRLAGQSSLDSGTKLSQRGQLAPFPAPPLKALALNLFSIGLPTTCQYLILFLGRIG